MLSAVRERAAGGHQLPLGPCSPRQGRHAAYLRAWHGAVAAADGCSRQSEAMNGFFHQINSRCPLGVRLLNAGSSHHGRSRTRTRVQGLCRWHQLADGRPGPDEGWVTRACFLQTCRTFAASRITGKIIKQQLWADQTGMHHATQQQTQAQRLQCICGAPRCALLDLHLIVHVARTLQTTGAPTSLMPALLLPAACLSACCRRV